MRSGNPVLKNETFARFGSSESTRATMTLEGTLLKSLLLLLIVGLCFAWSFASSTRGNGALMAPLLAIGSIGGFLVALLTTFKREWSTYTAPLYALLEGLFLGAFSTLVNSSMPGIALQAVTLTMTTLLALLGAYQAGWIRVDERLRSTIVSATFGIALFYLLSFALSFFGIAPLFQGSGLMSIAFSLFVTAIAASNLLLDFELIAQGSRRQAPKYMEWYSAFALLVTLVWLYLEMVRLLTKLKQRD